MMKTFKIFLLGLFFSSQALYCQGANTGIPKTDTIIKNDSMNLAIFVVDFLTYQFEKVNISYYSKCNNYCEADSLPFSMYFDSWWDNAHVYFHYKFDNSLLFRASIHWMGTGGIEYPSSFTPAANFPYVSNTVPLPADAEYYNTTIAGNYCSWQAYRQRAQMAWHAIDSLELTNIFANEQFRVGLYGYSRTEGEFDPNNADWIIFLYRGNTDPPFLTTDPCFPSFNPYPNPGNGILFLGNDLQPESIEVFDLTGVKQTEIDGGITDKIDLSNLPNGVYLLKADFKGGSRVSKISIIH